MARHVSTASAGREQNLQEILTAEDKPMNTEQWRGFRLRSFPFPTPPHLSLRYHASSPSVHLIPARVPPRVTGGWVDRKCRASARRSLSNLLEHSIATEGHMGGCKTPMIVACSIQMPGHPASFLIVHLFIIVKSPFVFSFIL